MIPTLDPTGGELIALAGRVGPHLAVLGDELTEAFEALHWWHEAGDQSPLPAVVLNVRVLEFVASRLSSAAWYEYADSYWKNAWVHSRIKHILLSICSEAARHEELVAASDRPILKSYWERISVRHGWGDYTMDAGEALAALPVLTRIFPDHHRIGRELSTIATRLSTPASLVQWCVDLDAEWKERRGRLQRVRNALSHGGPASSAVVSTVATFGRSLAAWALSATLEGILDGTGVASSHQAVQSREDGWRNGIMSASDIHTALFP